MRVPSQPIRVLHVDDEAEFATLASELLKRASEELSIETATSANEGLELLEAEQFDCVVSDYDMPDTNGLEFLKAVREEYTDLPFIFFTGKGSEEIASKAISAGVTDYLQKASGTEQFELLANRIHNSVAQTRAERRAAETERQLQELAASSEDILWMFTANWEECLFVNSAYSDLYGQSLETLQESAWNMLETVDPDDRDHVEKAMRRLSDGNKINIEYRVNTAENCQHWVWVQGVPIRDDEGEVVRIAGFSRDITDRKRRERKLEEQRNELRQYKRAVEESSDLLAGIDADYNYLIANQRYRNYHGLTEDQITELTAPEVLEGQWESEVKPMVDQVLEGEEVRYEMERQAADGDSGWFEVRYYPLRDEDGAVEGVVGGMRDITERKEREQEIEQLKDRFQALIRNSSDNITVVDENGIIQYESPSVERILGWEPEELVGENSFDYIHPDDRERVFETFLGAIEADELVTEAIQYRFKAADGSWVWLESVGSNQTNSAIDGYVINSRDISERKSTEQTITSLHEATSELLTANSRESVANRMVTIARDIIDLPHASVLQWKPTEERLTPLAVDHDAPDVLGPPPEFAPGEGIIGWVFEAGEAVVLDDAQSDDRMLARPAASPEIHGYMVIPIGDQGVFAAAAPTVGAFDQKDFEIASILSMYGRIRLEQLASKAALERKTERLEAFNRVVSHDLRNPLNVAKGYLGTEREQRDSEALATIDESLDRMETIIQDMLTLTREGEDIGDTERVSLRRLAEQCWQGVETSGSKLVVEGDLEVIADASQLRNLFENLFSNAIEHGGPAVTVTVGPLAKGAGFYVADDGDGIEPGVREELFESGYSTLSEGTGFGLSIVQDIAEGHGWEIEVSESEECGARFEIRGVQIVE